MANKITTLHPQNDKDTNIYPNIVGDNIPSESISFDKLTEGFQDRVNDDESNISKNTDDIRDLENRVSTNEDNISTNKNDISNLKEHISTSDTTVVIQSDKDNLDVGMNLYLKKNEAKLGTDDDSMNIYLNSQNDRVKFNSIDTYDLLDTRDKTELQTNIDNANASITENKSDITTINQNIDYINNDIASLTDNKLDNATYETDKATIESAIDGKLDKVTSVNDTSIPTPTSSLNIANKSYVDSKAIYYHYIETTAPASLGTDAFASIIGTGTLSMRIWWYDTCPTASWDSLGTWRRLECQIASLITDKTNQTILPTAFCYKREGNYVRPYILLRSVDMSINTLNNTFVEVDLTDKFTESIYKMPIS